ncbi:MAG: S8 family serine peptidase [Armatimonadetes bacterium]|nr:S8 family serine peptidase [Armatimonadota bacterium]
MTIRSLPQPRVEAGYAEKKEARPSVALLDTFEKSDTGTAHGEMVESVLLRSGPLKDEDVQRFQNAYRVDRSPQAVVDAPAATLLQDYGEFVAQAAAVFLKATSANLRTILEENPSIRVISQSQSQSAGRIVSLVYPGLKDDPGFQARLGQALGLGKEAPLPELVEQLLERAETVLREDPAVAAARREYLHLERQAYERGLVHVVPAGNLGQFAAEIEQLGASSSSSTFRSLLANEYTTVVGSTDERGQPASFNSPRAGTEVLAPGVGIVWQDGDATGTVDGTSFSVPQVAGRAAGLLRAHPGWTPFQVESALTGIESYR